MSPLAARVNVHLKVTSPREASPPVQPDDDDDAGKDERDGGERSLGADGDPDVSVDSLDSDTQIREVDTTTELDAADTVHTDSEASVDSGTVGGLSWVTRDGDSARDTSTSFVDTTTSGVDASDEDEDHETTFSEEEDAYVPEADEDEQSRRRSSAVEFSPRHSEALTAQQYEKENVVPTKVEDGPSRDADDGGYDEEKSLIISSGTKSGKKKRSVLLAG